jgi:hypothetical protein
MANSAYQHSIEITNWPKDPTVTRIVRATFPSYKRKKVLVRATETITFSDLNWSGGTRSEYRACTLGGVELGSMDRYHQYAPWDVRQVEGQSVPIPQGSVVVRGGYFCGKESLLTIHVHPADMPKYLPVAPVAVA